MKNILKIVSFGLILVILLNIMAAVFNEGLLARKRCVIYYDRRIAELSKEPEGEINVLFVKLLLEYLFHKIYLKEDLLLHQESDQEAADQGRGMGGP